MAISNPVERYEANPAGQTSTTVFSPASTIAAGTVAVMAVRSGTSGSHTVASVADSKGNTWTVDHGNNPQGTADFYFCSAQIVAAVLTSDTITITYGSSTSTAVVISVQEVTGLAGSSVFDKSADGAGSGTTISSGATATLAQASEIVFAMCGSAGGGGFTQGATYTKASTLGGASFSGFEYKIVAATTAVTADGTFGTTGNWSVSAVTYKGAVVPVNTVAPVASGSSTVGSVVSTTNGTWTGTPTPTFTYQWQRDVLGNGVYTNIASATASSYTLVLLDDACNVRCVVTGTNAAGAAAANSNSILDTTPVPGTGAGMYLPLLGVG